MTKFLIIYFKRWRIEFERRYVGEDIMIYYIFLSIISTSPLIEARSLKFTSVKSQIMNVQWKRELLYFIFWAIVVLNRYEICNGVWHKHKYESNRLLFLLWERFLWSESLLSIWTGVPRIFTDDKHAEVSVLLSQFSGEDDCCITDYIKNSRININIRQVN